MSSEQQRHTTLVLSTSLCPLLWEWGGRCSFYHAAGYSPTQTRLPLPFLNRKLKLSDNNRKVTWGKELQSYPDHPDRFDNWWSQLLCRTGLTGRCYWEVKWRGEVNVSVSYRGIRRRGCSDECVFGFNDQSWSLICSDRGYSVYHNNIRTEISPPPPLLLLLLLLLFSSDTLIHLHTFNTTFTEPLYPGFVLVSGSSVSLCGLMVHSGAAQVLQVS
uniref:SPRY-associated domain-containing protein n=1 Tax=Labrus bergylta TaxID=56723 RepID=A0A3Q3LMS1_9LABR